MTVTRFGLIGCGFFAGNHLNAWRQLASEGVELAAVCDVDERKAREAARRFGAKAFYTSAEAMLTAERLDLVDIVTQVRSHRPPTIVQKPFGLSLDDCIAMRNLSEQLGVPLAVHENFRFQAPMQMAKENSIAGRSGKPTGRGSIFAPGTTSIPANPICEAKRSS